MRLRDENGQMLVLTALSMMLLFGFMALAVDVGLLFRARRQAQTAADAAAVAAALDYEYNISRTSAQNAGYTAATANGYDHTKSGITVTVNVPPNSGPKNAAQGYAEAIVGSSNPTVFMSMFNFHNVEVSARAVAGIGGPGPACIYTLGTAGITGSGSGAINASNCTIDDNGNITLSGNESIIAQKINLFGTAVESGGGSITPTPVRSRTVADPLASVTPPTVPGVCNGTISFTTPNSPGCYQQVVTSSGGTINLNAGTYIINGSIISSGNLNIVGTGVTLYLANGGGIIGSGSVGLNLTAPTSGPYDGIALWVTGSSGLTLSGATTTNFNGILYMPNGSLTVSGGTGMTLNSDLIVQNFTFSGTTTLQNYVATNASTALGSGGASTFSMVE